jgi:hypothetical protein
MVSSGVLMLLMTAMYALLTFGMRYYQTAQAAETVHQQAMLGVRRLATELRLSNATTISYPSPPTSIIFLSADQASATPGPWSHTSTGQLEWHKWVCYYLDGTNLIRSEQALGAPVTLPPVPAPPSLASFQALPDNRVVARELSALSIGAGSAPGLVELTITARAATTTTKLTEFSLRTQTRMEN